ncbi:MAG: hypothetical protein H7X71_03430 [Chitinophagales bacterium]|nr:hypothetical protein [Chitinophagales bacterium]
MKNFCTLLLILLGYTTIHAQTEDMLDLLGEDEPTIEYVKNAFKSSRVINGHSMEMLAPGAMDFRILHRFGEVTGGAYEMFGLDQASMRMGFDFGITRNLTIGVGRSTFQKELDGFIKYRIIQQSKGARIMPFSILYVTGMTGNGLKFEDTTRENYFSSRLSFYHQLIIGRKFNDNFTLQVSPTVVHRNLVETAADPNDLYALGIGGRVKLTQRLALTTDYYYVFNRVDSSTYNPLSIGIDIETGGHVFQLHFSNTVGMNERAFISDTQAQWAEGEVRFGFNLSRMFQIVK